VENEKKYEQAEEAFTEGDYAVALKVYQDIFEHDQKQPNAVWGIAECFHSLGQIGEAIAWYKRYLSYEPNEPEALHMLAALGEGRAPLRASDDYVKAHFDRFAEDFDKQLLEELDYKAPDILVNTLQTQVGSPTGLLSILDAGCGTGLCGPKLKPYAARLDGVDISREMLSFSRKLEVYDNLFEEELTRHFETTEAQYDVVIAADTLCYFGDLALLFKLVGRILREKGIFLFSVEADEIGADFSLTQSGRYTHARNYITTVANSVNLRNISVRSETLRTEYGEAVIGDIWVLSK